MSVYVCLAVLSPSLLHARECTEDAKHNTTITTVAAAKNKNTTVQRTKQYNLIIEALYTGFVHPWGITWYTAHTQQQDPIIISERNGGLWVIVGNTIKCITQLPQDIYQQGQGGWFDLVQSADGTVYASYAKGNAYANTTAVLSFRLDEEQIFNNTYDTVAAQQVTVIYEMNKKARSTIHFGGMLTIGFDDTGKEVLFLGLGDRGQRYESQSLLSDHGTIQAIALDGSESRSISYGHRNPQGLYYDSVRKQLYETEHGPKGGDEFNRISIDSTAPKNYGWPVVSYGKEYSTGKQVGEGTSKEGMEEPLYYWDISPALSGLSVYYGTQFEQWNGNLFAAALKFQQIYRIRLDDSGTKVQEIEQLLDKKYGRIRSIKMHNDDIYFITDKNNGSIYRITKKAE